MYKLLGGLQAYFKWQDIQTDNAVFRLHNVFTTVLLLTCSMIITATQYVGRPIQCIVNGLPTHVVNTFCWITSTFTMPDAFRREVSLVSNLLPCSNLLEDIFLAMQSHYYHLQIQCNPRLKSCGNKIFTFSLLKQWVGTCYHLYVV